MTKILGYYTTEKMYRAILSYQNIADVSWLLKTDFRIQ